MSPAARTLKALRARGFIAGKVEQTVPKTFIKRDLFGFGDIVATDGQTIVIVQVTSGDHVAHRLEKIRSECRDAALAWLRAGGRIEVHGWRLAGARGERKTWQMRTVDLTRDGDMLVDREVDVGAVAVGVGTG